jgi:hypothetical protein
MSPYDDDYSKMLDKLWRQYWRHTIILWSGLFVLIVMLWTGIYVLEGCK